MAPVQHQKEDPVIDEMNPNARRVHNDSPATVLAKMQTTSMMHLLGQVSALRQDVDALKAELQRRPAGPVPLTGPSSATSEVVDYLLKSVDVLFANQRSNQAWAGERIRDHAVYIDELTACTMPWMITFTDEVQAIIGKPVFCDPSRLPHTPPKPKA